jgi:hypothetical protein
MKRSQNNRNRLMAFDQTTRNRLQRFVNDARRVLEEEFTRQLQNDYGWTRTRARGRAGKPAPHQRRAARNRAHPARHPGALLRQPGDMMPKGAGSHRARAGLHRAQPPGRTAHGRGAWAAGRVGGQRLPGQGLSALCALAGTGWAKPAMPTASTCSACSTSSPRTCRAVRPLLAAGPPVPARGGAAASAGADQRCRHRAAVGRGRNHRLDLPVLQLQGRAQSDARCQSQAPRNSRELAVRNQFFTPRYVVEFLVDNTLGRLWFNATGGKSGAARRCQYLLVKPDEQPQAATKLRDPRTLKLLDPACGSMHFGLYAFDLFLPRFIARPGPGSSSTAPAHWMSRPSPGRASSR